MYKLLLVLTICLGAAWGLFPAQADEVNKINFNLSPKKDSVDNMNRLIYLEARVKELEKASPKSWGLAYLTEDGQLKLKAEDGGKDWDWDGKTWTRLTSSTSTDPNCPPGSLK